MWDFPDVIKFRIVALIYTISDKAIRLRDPDYNPDRAQKLISSSMSRHLTTRNISSKPMRAFLSNLANRQTNKHGQKHLPPPLSEVISYVRMPYRLIQLRMKDIWQKLRASGFFVAVAVQL